MKKTREDQVAEILDRNNIQYVRQYRIRQYTVDFYIPGKKIFIEHYGCYWHGCRECYSNLKKIVNEETGFDEQTEYVRKRDEERIQRLRTWGYAPFIIWEHGLKSEASIDVWIEQLKWQLDHVKATLRANRKEKKKKETLYPNIQTVDSVLDWMKQFLDVMYVRYEIKGSGITDRDIYLLDYPYVFSIRSCMYHGCSECGYVLKEKDKTFVDLYETYHTEYLSKDDKTLITIRAEHYTTEWKETIKKLLGESNG